MIKSNLLFTLSILFIGLIFYSCQKDHIDSEFPYEAEIIGKSLDCGDFEIKVTKGTQRVRLITGANSGNLYTAKNLPENLKTEGLKIKLNIREIKNIELTPCTTLGVPYPWLFVTKADEF